MLAEHLCSLLGRWYLPNPVVGVLLVIDNLEEGIFGSFEHLRVGYYGHGVTAATDYQVPREAIVDIPAGAGKALLYLLRIHLCLDSQQR